MCFFNLCMVLVANTLPNALVVGVTNGEPAEALVTTFWDTISGSWENGNYYSFFLALIFNVAVPVFSLVCMVSSWFTPYLRGALVVLVALMVKWTSFHGFSNLLNGIALAFEIRITNPIIGDLLTAWIHTYAGALVPGLLLCLHVQHAHRGR